MDDWPTVEQYAQTASLILGMPITVHDVIFDGDIVNAMLEDYFEALECGLVTRTLH